MWQVLHQRKQADPAFTSSATELLLSTSRNLIVATGVVYFACHTIVTVASPGEIGARVWLVTFVQMVTIAVSLRLLQRSLLLAQAAWQTGLAASTALAVHIFGRPEFAFLYALLPLMAAVTVGWPAGVLAEGAVVALVVWHSFGPLQPHMPLAYGIGIILGGTLTGLLGWASSHSLLTATHWSLHSLDQAQRNMEEARERRAQFYRVAKDLDQAYHRLERANAALVAAWRAADEAERFRAEFATNVSHELRTPLNLIVGFSETMMNAPESYGGAQLPGCYRSDVSAIHRSARHLLGLVDDVLDLARIQAGRIPLVRDEVDLVSLIGEATGVMREYVAAKGLGLEVDVEEGVPHLWIDRLRIRQVLLNLLVNASRFTERGAIRVHAFRRGEEVVLEVKDTGRGIPEQDMPRIFEEFRTTDAPLSAWHSGTGLGLPISKKYVELHGGQMGAESINQQGSIFWFTLPCRVGDSIPRGLPDVQRPQPVLPAKAPERIVVVAHEDPAVARLLQRYLGGHKVIGAGDVEKGVLMASELKAVALVMDAAATPTIPTGQLPIIRCPMPNRRQTAVALGADDLLVKPVSREQLLAALDRSGRTVRRILIADDEPDVVRLFRRMLHGRISAEDCLEAYNGEEALQLLRTRRPDLVLLDLVMPRLDGRGVLERMAADEELAKVPVILISAKGEDGSSLPLDGAIEVSRGGGFEMADVVRIVESALNALSPGWHAPQSRA